MSDDFLQAASNAVAGGVSSPVDLIAWALRKAGVPGQGKPVLGSDWMAEHGLTRPVKAGVNQILGETVGNLADPVGALGAAAKTAILIPALLRSGRKIDDAINAVERGASEQELWDTYKLFRYPGQITDDLRVRTAQAKFGAELPQGTLKLVSSTEKLPDVLENSALYHEIPSLRDTLVKFAANPAAPKAQGVYAHPEGKAGVIYIDPKNSVDYIQTFWHELNHAVNAHTGQPGTIGSVSRIAAPYSAKKKQVAEMADLLETTAPDLTALVEALRRGGIAMSGRQWPTSAGERLAEADAFRAINPGERWLPPSAHMNEGNQKLLPVEKPIPDDVMLNLDRSLLLHEGNAPEALSYLLRKLK